MILKLTFQIYLTKSLSLSECHANYQLHLTFSLEKNSNLRITDLDASILQQFKIENHN